MVYRLSALTSITIPDGVTEIDGWAFEGCSKLASITLGSGLESIGPVAFNGCDKLTDVYFRGTEAQWKTLSVDAGNDAILNANIHFIA